MAFLTKRMIRQKVNGNKIRTASNPDDEPDLDSFPPCTPAGYRIYHPVAPVSPSDNSRKRPRVAAPSPAVPYEASLPDTTTPDVLPPVDVPVSFPLRLQRILDKIEAEGGDSVIGWCPHGRAFLVHDPHRLVHEVLPRFGIHQSRYSSFQRQLHMYNFVRLSAGPDKGAYYQEFFERGNPGQCWQMTRTRVNGKGTRQPANPMLEPDLRALPPLPPIALGTVVEVPESNDGVKQCGRRLVSSHEALNERASMATVHDTTSDDRSAAMAAMMELTQRR
jgi:HSF-type DNA-binding